MDDVDETQAAPLPAVLQRMAPELDTEARLGRWLAAAESDSNDPDARGMAAALRFFLAAQLGLTPLAAAELSLIKGRLVVSAKLVRALAHQHGYRVVRRNTSAPVAESCTAVLYARDGSELGRVTYTIAQARKAGLVKPGSGWEKNPERMLWARASKYVVDDYAPDVSLGLVTDDEAAEIVGLPAEDSEPEPEHLAADDERDWPEYAEPDVAPVPEPQTEAKA